jgi:hypothetical protein
MMKNSEGVVQSSKVGLADRARVSDKECEESLGVLLSPDVNDTSGVEDGKRIREVPGGWQIINHDMYRFSTEAKREFWRASKAEERERKLRVKEFRMKSKPIRGEVRAVKLENNGDRAGAEAVAAEGLSVERT